MWFKWQCYYCWWNSAVNNLDEIQSTVAYGNSNPDVFGTESMIKSKVKSRVEFKENDNCKTAKG